MCDHTEAENLMFMSLSAQIVRAERTKVLRKQTTGRKKKYLTNRWDTEKLNISLKTETTVHCGIIFCEGSQNTNKNMHFCR